MNHHLKSVSVSFGRECQEPLRTDHTFLGFLLDGDKVYGRESQKQEKVLLEKTAVYKFFFPSEGPDNILGFVNYPAYSNYSAPPWNRSWHTPCLNEWA